VFNRELLIGLSTVFGWTPGVILALAAVFTALTGAVSAVNHEWWFGLVLVLLGISGTLGFVAMTSICWGLKLSLAVRRNFLAAGMLALFVVDIVGFTGLIDWFPLYFSWMNVYLYISPLAIGILHLILDSKALKQSA
jgi:hypothetical protein